MASKVCRLTLLTVLIADGGGKLILRQIDGVSREDFAFGFLQMSAAHD
ncbi:MAG: hypothetical protein LUO84_00990 [Methanomassiliicoccales archaeon]|nr:hypothetical protein [Methanomassiliicoccales archaeon]